MDEILAQILLGLIFLGTLIAGLYIHTLTRFFKELRGREPALWQKIGSPTLLNMLILPLINFRKFYAFLPVLKQRRDDARYLYAERAWRLLVCGLLFCVVLLVNVVLLAWTVLA